MTTRQILVKARKIIAEPQAWAKEAQAYTDDGEPVDFNDPAACRYCAAAAIAVVASTVQERWEAYDALAATLGFKQSRRIVAWNNAKRRKHTDVLAAFDEAIAAQGRKP